MKKLLKILFVLISANLFSQYTVINLKDPHIVAQEDRMVYKEWGNWMPKPKYFMGIQYNPHYMMTWGWLSPKRNRRYKDGDDIRPLSLTGEQTQRNLIMNYYKEANDKRTEETDLIYQEAKSDLLHTTALTAKADYLYLLYYKKKLNPIDEFSEERLKKELQEWFEKSPIEGHNRTLIINRLKSLNIYQNYIIDMDVLKEKYKYSLTVDMPRGKRILSYHDLMLEYQKLYRRFWNAVKRFARIISITHTDTKGKTPWEKKHNLQLYSDLQIFINVITNL